MQHAVKCNKGCRPVRGTHDSKRSSSKRLIIKLKKKVLLSFHHGSIVIIHLIIIDHRRRIIAWSLFVVGEIGVNDYLVALGNNTAQEVQTLVPHIVAAVHSVLTVSYSPPVQIKEFAVK